MMPRVFGSTTTLLAPDFVEIFPQDRLQYELFALSVETGVKFNRTKQTFTITGPWESMQHAYIFLEDLMKKVVQNVYDSEKSTNMEKEKLPKKPLPVQQQSLQEFPKVKDARKPVQTKAANRPGCYVPSPVVFYNSNKDFLISDKNFEEVDAVADIKPSVEDLFQSGTGMTENDKKDKTSDSVLLHDIYEKEKEIVKQVVASFTEEDVEEEENTDLEEDVEEEDEEEDESEYKETEEDDATNRRRGSDPKNLSPDDRKDKFSDSDEEKGKSKTDRTQLKVTSDARTDLSTKEVMDEETERPQTRRSTRKSYYRNQVVEKNTFMENEKRPKRKSNRPVRLIKEFDKSLDKKSSTENTSSESVIIKEEELDSDSDHKPSVKKKRGRKKRMGGENKTYPCSKCDYVGKKAKHLNEHRRRQHAVSKQCKICGKTFGFNKDLNRHLRTVHSDPEFFCNTCNRFYKCKRVYERHLETHNEGYIRPSFKCQTCDKSFSTKYVLNAHVKAEHLGLKKTYLCPTCGKSFTQKNSYLQHANVHAGIRPFVCDVCGKDFTYEKSLREHRFMHDEVRRFQCEICSKTFKQTTSLRIHMKVHQESKDHICSSCGKGFTQKQALVRHERIHNGEKPFSCAKCQKTFSDTSIIRRHIILIHKSDPKKWQEHVVSHLKHDTSFFVESNAQKSRKYGRPSTSLPKKEDKIDDDQCKTPEFSSPQLTVPQGSLSQPMFPGMPLTDEPEQHIVEHDSVERRQAEIRERISGTPEPFASQRLDPHPHLQPHLQHHHQHQQQQPLPPPQSSLSTASAGNNIYHHPDPVRTPDVAQLQENHGYPPSLPSPHDLSVSALYGQRDGRYPEFNRLWEYPPYSGYYIPNQRPYPPYTGQ
ncbi:hypothetical protein ACJMK2_032276 [Sinanodonta woodiana]|uniref:C2H2-type domain-containing protein n=1 Tax=Sinanodonta woodiana TaxID=1069815 RepID=A0ABD3X190_SINWO